MKGVETLNNSDKGCKSHRNQRPKPKFQWISWELETSNTITNHEVGYEPLTNIPLTHSYYNISKTVAAIINFKVSFSKLLCTTFNSRILETGELYHVRKTQDCNNSNKQNFSLLYLVREVANGDKYKSTK